MKLSGASVRWGLYGLLLLPVVVLVLASTFGHVTRGRSELSPTGKYRCQVHHAAGTSVVSINVQDEASEAVVVSMELNVPTEASPEVFAALETHTVSMIWEQDESSVTVDGIPGVPRIKLDLDNEP